MAHLKKQPQVY